MSISLTKLTGIHSGTFPRILKSQVLAVLPAAGTGLASNPHMLRGNRHFSSSNRRREIHETSRVKEASMKHPRFGTFLKNARKKRKLSQWAVAQQLGYSSAQFISNLERGISPPPV